MRSGVTLERLEGCARCGGVHKNLTFSRMARPVQNEDGDLQFWAPCPANGDPILLHMDEHVYLVPNDHGDMVPWNTFHVSIED